MLRPFLLAALLACRAHADCVTADDLVQGITFTRQDGFSGQIKTRGGTLQIEYVTGKNGWYDSRTTRYGIFETHFTAWLSDAVLVGSSPPEYDWRFSPQPPKPEAGKVWDATVAQIKSTTGYGTEMVEMVNRQQSSLAAHFEVLAEAEGTLSGCTYRILPVEARFTGKGQSFTRRWIYFPDLGFGLETRRDDVTNGLTALTAG